MIKYFKNLMGLRIIGLVTILFGIWALIKAVSISQGIVSITGIVLSCVLIIIGLILALWHYKNNEVKNNG